MGQVLDNETGLMLYRNRYYHVELGRFISRDPIGYDAGDENLYRYVSNIPISSVDFLGQAISPALPWIARILVAGTTILVPVSTPVIVGTVIVVSVGVGVVVAIQRTRAKPKPDPCRSDYHACLMSSLADQSFGNRCYECYLSCSGSGVWSGHGGCDYWNYKQCK